MEMIFRMLCQWLTLMCAALQGTLTKRTPGILRYGRVRNPGNRFGSLPGDQADLAGTLSVPPLPG
uniref:Uncharacterized protein n=1 Tax=Anguilla anguilla TaxID=7936 RepID=A0A0E9R0Q6_ANGAN